MKFYYTEYSSPLGKITAVSDGEALTGLGLENQKYFDARSGNILERNDRLKIFEDTKNWLDRYFAYEKPSPYEINLKPSGSNFRSTVWKLLCEIPYGEVVTYGDIAKKAAFIMGKQKMSAQAVGGAVGHNPIAIIIPCHRVVGAGGNLTGYGGGIHIKTALLELEGLDMSKFYVPKKGTAL